MSQIEVVLEVADMATIDGATTTASSSDQALAPTIYMDHYKK